MSRRNRERRAAFFNRNPVCCLCGGETPATTIEHAPPRSLFVDRRIPGAFAFPACARCNSESKSADQIVAASTLIMGAAIKGHITQEYLNRLLQGIANNDPDFIRMFGRDSERSHIRTNGLLREVFSVEVSREAYVRWIDPWAAKMGLAFWYHHQKEIFPTSGLILVHWFTNEGLFKGEFPADVFQRLPMANHIKQGRISNAHQFFYRYGFTDDAALGTFLFVFHQASALWVLLAKDRAVGDQFRDKMVAFSTSPESGIKCNSCPVGYL